MYFITGCYTGKLALTNESTIFKKSNYRLVAASIILLMMLLIKHRLALPEYIGNILNRIDLYNILYVQRFPNNIPALIFALSSWYFLLQVSNTYWRYISGLHLTKWLLVFGRNPLLSFVLHVYFAKSIEIIITMFDINILTIYILIISNYIAGYFILSWYEKTGNENIKKSIKYLFS